MLKITVLWFCLLLLVLPGLTACQKKNASPEVKTHSADGYLGITEANPNMPLTNGYRTYQSDMLVMETAVKSHYPQLTVESIRLNGTSARIRLLAPPGTSSEELRRLGEEVQRTLAAEAPRYDPEVTVTAK